MIDGQRQSVERESVGRSLHRLPRPQPRPEFRDRLRAQFVHGAIPDRHKIETGRTRLPSWRIAATAAAFAGIVVVTAVLANRGPAWRLTGAAGSGTVAIDGQPTLLGTPEAIARRLYPGAVVVLPADAQLDIQLPGIVAIQIVGGSRVILPGSPGRWFGRSMVGSLEAGEIRITTGPAFGGCRLEVVTPEVRAIVTGTTLAVLRQPDASCVCVLEGQVAMVGVASADTVWAGLRRSVYRDGRTPKVEPILPMETMKLTMLRAKAEQDFGR